MIAAFSTMVLFAAASVGTPGPANIAIMGASARFGFRRTIAFILGVIVGKQAVIWPVGLGLLQLADTAPNVFLALKLASAAYMIWLAWRIAGMSFATPDVQAVPPGFLAGLIVHPLNPKAWAMVAFIFSGLAPDMGGPLPTAALVAFTLLTIQLILQPLWGLAGQAIATRLSGSAERAFFVGLAIIMLVTITLAVTGSQTP